MRWSSRARAISSSSFSSLAAARNSISWPSSRGKFSFNHVRARSRKDSTLSICVSVEVVVMCSLDLVSGDSGAQRAEDPAVLRRRAVGEPVDGDPPEVQVEVVLVGDADAAVQLDAVLDQLGGVLARVGLGGARRPGGLVVALVVPRGDVGERMTRLEPH